MARVAVDVGGRQMPLHACEVPRQRLDAPGSPQRSPLQRVPLGGRRAKPQRL